VPLVFWHGKQDNNVPFEWSELIAKKNQNAVVKILPNEGHLVIFNYAKSIFTDLKFNSP